VLCAGNVKPPSLPLIRHRAVQLLVPTFAGRSGEQPIQISNSQTSFLRRARARRHPVQASSTSLLGIAGTSPAMTTDGQASSSALFAEAAAPVVSVTPAQ